MTPDQKISSQDFEKIVLRSDSGKGYYPLVTVSNGWPQVQREMAWNMHKSTEATLVDSPVKYLDHQATNFDVRDLSGGRKAKLAKIGQKQKFFLALEILNKFRRSLNLLK